MPRPSRPSTRSRRSFVLSACGLEGAGKTHFALSAPSKKLYISVDPNTQAVIEKYYDVNDVNEVDGDVIEYAPLRMPAVAFSEKEDVQKEAEGAWESFIDLLRPIVTGKSDIRCVIADTATELDT